MPRRVLLVSANAYDVPYPVFPLGLAQVNAALRAAGHTTCWIDCLADQRPLEEILDEFQPDLVGISLRNIDDVAFRQRETFYGSLQRLCARIRQHRPVPVIVGGSGFSIFPESLLEQSGADYGIQGEGEAPFLALLEALEHQQSPHSIPGLVFRVNGSIRRNPQQPGRLDRVMDPVDRPQRLVDYYAAHSLMLNVQTQRGCSFECCYCTYPLIEGRRHRRRPPHLVAEELAHIESCGLRYAFVVDSVFNSSPTHVLETCAAIRQRGLRLQWGCFLRPQGLTAEQMQAMAAAGLAHIEFGSDSFSDRVLEAYGKRLSFEDIRHAAQLARAARLEQCHFLILGGPGETPETLEETLARSTELEGAVILPIVGMRVYPGTPLHALALRQGVLDPATNLLEPFHYIAPGLTHESIQARLAQHVQSHPNWIVGEPPASFHQLVQRLRQRGVVGPLWTYFAMLQKLPLGTPTPS